MIFGRNKTELSALEEKRQIVVDFKYTFNTEQGKRVLLELMNHYHILNTHKGDLFKEGQRSVVLDILALNGMSIADLDHMIRGEQQNESY